MTDYDSNPSPLTKLPLRKFEHFRVSTQDAPPALLDDTSIACAVCHDHASRYTCPRCEIPYCSIACYQAHGTSEETSCTEGFYQDRVRSVVQLEQKAKQQDTYNLLNRTYQHDQETPLDLVEAAEEEDDLNGEDMIKLFELLNLLEEEEEPDQSQQQQQQLAALLAQSPKLKAAFEEAVQKGEAQQLALQSWDPWWRPVLSSQAEADEQEEPADDINNVSSSSGAPKTLDERLLRAKPLESLLPPPKKGGAAKTVPNLCYNLLEILFNVAKILRLYHGAVNAKASEGTAVEASLTMVQGSSVLNRDARYECLEEVMMEIITIDNTSKDATTETTPSRTLLADDVALLVANRRFIGRALLEAMDILKAAIASLKRTKQSSAGEEDGVPDVADLRRKHKKMEFFLSWSQKAMIEPNLPHGIRAWVNHWAPPSKQEDSKGAEDDRLKAVEGMLGDECSSSRKENDVFLKPKRHGPTLIQELD